ncbi:MAG: hypothetical protein RL087_1717 [Pseudomonadota bacterium]
MNSGLKILHVLCACLFVGNVVVSGVWAAMAERTRDHAIVSFSNRMVLITDLFFTLGGSIGVVGTGYLMAHHWGGESAHPWIQWSYILFGLSGLIWLLVLLPLQLRQRQILRQTTRITPQYLRLSRLWQVWGAVATVLPLPIFYFMITKSTG